MNNWLPYVLFVVLFVTTFKLAWKMLAELMAMSLAEHAVKQPGFWVKFVLYRLVIAAPYLALLLFGESVPLTLRKLAWGWVLLGAVLGVTRFVGKDRVIRGLWWAYSFIYDSLLKFAPYRALLDRVLKRLDPEPGMQVLELGCGTGNLIQELCDQGVSRVVGVDSSAAMLKRARKKLRPLIAQGRVELVHADVAEFLAQQPSSQYDRISLVNVLYAMGDRATAWRHCRRLLVPGGYIVATVSDRGGSKPIIREHLASLPWYSLISLRLLGVMIVDFFISSLAGQGIFEYPSQQQLRQEIELVGGKLQKLERCYGGPEEGVNLLFEVA